MKFSEHDYEPIPGLPAPLPAGETILWQGAPKWETFARRAMRVRMVAGYFVAIAIWGVTTRLSSGMPVPDVAMATLKVGGLAVVALALLVLFAWLVGRSTLYTVTTRRVVIRYGIAMPITIQIAFKMIDSAGLHVWPDGSGDIALSLRKGQRVAYLVMWPHARPWKLTKSQPTLRGIPDAAAVAQILGRALAASASQAAPGVSIAASAGASVGAAVPAAA
jgi:hypothetical protein